MLSQLAFDVTVAWACARKEIRSGLADRTSSMVFVFLPINFLILMSLFALSGGLAPTAVVLNDTGPYAQQLYSAMAGAHSFRLEQTSAQQAQDLIRAGSIVAVVTVPADFDSRIQNNQPVSLDVQINNLNTDFTNDIRRAIPLSITSFYAQAFPNIVTVSPSERDAYAHDTDYIPYLTVSILVIALMVGCLLQAGTGAATEWERATIKELLMSPASRWAIAFGKMLGALSLAFVAALIVFAVLIVVVGVWPVHWDELVGVSLLTMIIFVAWGTLLGTLVKHRQALIPLALGTSLPLFFISGPFGPISFFPGLSGQVISVVAELFPPYYAIVLQQHAFHDFTLNTLGVGGNALILALYTLVVIALSAFVLRRSTVTN